MNPGRLRSRITHIKVHIMTRKTLDFPTKRHALSAKKACNGEVQPEYCTRTVLLVSRMECVFTHRYRSTVHNLYPPYRRRDCSGVRRPSHRETSTVL